MLCNISQQEFYFKTDYVQDGWNDVRFVVMSEWYPSDIIIPYVAFSNDEFFTNFYLCSQ